MKIYNDIYIANVFFDLRKRYRKEYLRPGDIVVYRIESTSKDSFYEKSVECGIFIVEPGDSFPDKMSVYEATPEEMLRVTLLDMRQAHEDFLNCSFEDMLINMIRQRIKKGDAIRLYNLKKLLFALPYVVSEEEREDLSKRIWLKCRDEIGAVGMNFKKQSAEYFSILVAVSMIISSQKTKQEQAELSELLKKHWKEFSALYSLFYGRNITTDHHRFIELVSFILDKPEREQYLHLYLMAIGNVQEKVEKIMRYSPIDNRRRILEKISIMQRHCPLVEQKDDLDELFQVLFPQSFQNFLANDNPIASVEEMQEALKESQKTMDLLHKVEEYAKILQSELDDAIKMQSLKEALSMCDPATARAIFAQLDMVLEGNNSVWDKHRKQLKYEVNDRYDRLMLPHPNKVTHIHQAGSITTIETNQAPIQIGQQNIIEGTLAKELVCHSLPQIMAK